MKIKKEKTIYEAPVAIVNTIISSDILTASDPTANDIDWDLD